MKEIKIFTIAIIFIFPLLFPPVLAFDASSADYSLKESFVVYDRENISSSDYNLTGIVSYLSYANMSSSDYQGKISLLYLEEPKEEAPIPKEEAPITEEKKPAGVGTTRLSNFTLNREVIKIKLAQGETKTEKLKIRNTGDNRLTIQLEIQDLEDFLYFSRESIGLNASEEGEITLAVTAAENAAVDVYTGRIIAKAGPLEREVIVVIEVTEKEALFDVGVVIPEEFKTLKGGDEIKADIVLYNFGTLMPVDVYLTLEIRDMEGNAIDSRQESLAVEEQLLIERTFKLPDYMKQGYYLFYVRLDYENQTATGSDMFIVLEREEFGLLQILLIYWQIILGGLIGLGGGAFFLKKRIEEDTKETFEEEQKQIKELLEQAKTDESKWKDLERKYRDSSTGLKLLREIAKGKIGRDRETIREERDRMQRVISLLEEQFEEGKIKVEAYEILKARLEQKIRELDEKLIE